MQSHFNLSDDDFEQQFANCSFHPSFFSHEAHLRLAYIHLKKYVTEKALLNICEQVKCFTKHVGAQHKYNITLTIAAVLAVHHFIKKSSSDNFFDFIKEFPRLKYNFKDLMAQHYTIDIYRSISAKQQFLQPDLLPFD